MARDLFEEAGINPYEGSPSDAIRKVASESGYNPDFLVGLAKLETRGGDATIKGGGVDTFNLFNVKDFSGKGTGIRAHDKAEGSNDRYRQYSNHEESVRDLVSLLDRRYPGARDAKTATEFAQALKDGGYATDPNYVGKLARVIGQPAGEQQAPSGRDLFELFGVDPKAEPGRDLFQLAGVDPKAIPRKEVPSMSAGSVAQDIASGALQIGPTAIKGIADIARLATGDRVGTDTSNAMESGMQSIRDMVGSERAAAQRENFQRDMADDNVGLGEALLRNKGALADQLLPTIGSMFLPVGVAGAAGKLASVGQAAQAMSKADLVARVALAQKAAGIGTVAAQNAADTFAELLEKGVSMPDAYLGAGITVPFSVVAGVLTGGGAETAITRALTGSGIVKTGVAQAGKAAAREGAQEMGEEAGQITGEAVGTGQAPSLVGAGKRLAVAGTLGAAMGGGVDVATQFSGAGQQAQTPGSSAVTPPSQPVATQNQQSPGQSPAAAPPAAEADLLTKLAELELIAEQRDLTPEESTQIVGILAALRQQEADSGAEQATPVQLGGQAADAGAAPVDAAQQGAPAGSAGPGEVDVAGQPEQTQPLSTESADRQIPDKSPASEDVQAQQSELDVTGRPPASWVIKEKATGNVILETFDKAKVDALNTDKYEATPIGKHLASFNKPAPVNQQLTTEQPQPTQPAPTDFWSFAKTKGFTPGQIQIGSQLHTELKTEYDALKAGNAAPVLPPMQPQQNVDLQNRDRARAASVVQMSEIARNPDYMRLGPSRTPDSGAPMVFAVGDQVSIAPQNMGREDVAVMSDGQRVPFRYAVVDASTVNPSNFADGRQNPAFASTTPGTLKALNNGRTAGVRAAHEMGTAVDYIGGMKADAAMHGISADVIARTPNPMLVRLYSDADNTSGMAAKSQGQGLGMSPAELARQDAPLMDSSVLGVYADGEVTSAGNRDFVRAFIGKLQAAGQDVAGMMTADGQLSQDGRKRIQAALMQSAYGDSNIVEEMFDSTDTDIKAIGEALKTAAGRWANMRDSARLGAISPDVDITQNLLQAIGLIRKARRDNTGLFDLVSQPDLMTGETPDAMTVGVLRMFYSGKFLTRAVGKDKLAQQHLGDYMTGAMATSADAGMFGDVVTPADILATINPITEGQGNAENQPTESREQPTGRVTAGGGAGEGGQAVGRPGPTEGRTGSDQNSGSQPGKNAQAEAKQQVGAGNQKAEESDGAAEGRAGGKQQAKPGAAKPESVEPKKAKTVAKNTAKTSATTEKAAEVRALDEIGRATDGKPINPGDVFATLSGRKTSGYPKQAGQKYASQWLINNAQMEAESRGDDFNERTFRNTKPLKDGTLTEADRASMLMYLFGEQPAVVPSILKPLVKAETRQPITPRDAGDMRAGDVVVDGKGVEYVAVRARFDFIEVAPIVNGKANVSADTTFYFHLNPDTASAYQSRRNDPVYRVGRNLYDEERASQSGARAKQDNSLSVEMGGSTLDVDLGKPAHEANAVDVENAVRKRGFATERQPGARVDPMQQWRDAHMAAIEKAVADGKTVPARVLYDFPGLIHKHASEDVADMASDAMTDTFKKTGDYDKAVQAYRDFGQPVAEPLLTAPTAEEVVARQDAAEAAKRKAEADKRRADEEERMRRERADIAQASVAAADTFELGQDPMANLTGQQDIFGAPAEPAAPVVSANTVFTEDAAAKARARLKSKLGRLNSGIDPETMMDGITLAGYHIEKGARTFAAYARAMLADLGDGVKPYLKSWYMGVALDPRATGFSGMSNLEQVLSTDIDAVLGEVGNSGLNQPPPDRVSVVSSLFDNLPQRQTLIEQGFDALNVTNQKRVVLEVINGIQDNKIFQAVVESIPIDVMDMLTGEQFTSNGLLSNPSVLANALAIDGQKPIPANVRSVINSLVSVVQKGAPTGAVSSTGARDSFVSSGELDTTANAGENRHGKSRKQGGADTVPENENYDVNALMAQENSDVPRTDAGLEPDSQKPAPERAMGDAVPAGGLGPAAADAGQAGGSTSGKGRGRQPRGDGVPAGGTTAGGERSDFSLPGGNATADAANVATGADFSERGSDIGLDGVRNDPVPAAQVDAVAQTGNDLLTKEQRQRAAEKVAIKPGDLDNIKATLPYLLEGQQEDVQKTEARFAQPDGYGMLFTNGTGTGKTFTGLGVVKRMQRQGKTNILIVVPDDKIAADWMASSVPMGLRVTTLKNTKDAGQGIVIATYANLGQNDALASRKWDMVVADEVHELMKSADGKVTTYLANLRAITHHPDGAFRRHRMLYAQEHARMAEVSAQIDANNKIMSNADAMAEMVASVRRENEALEREQKALAAKLRDTLDEVKAEVKAMQGAKRARLLSLSATPFAYEFTVDWANGYLFDYAEGQTDESKEFRGYNQGSNRDRFFMSHFGYSMRYNKLTKPDPSKVDTGLLQRNFNGWLRKKGSLSARMLDVPADYDRRFVLVDSAIGNTIDDALNWIKESSYEGDNKNGFAALHDVINEKFDYLSRRYLLEAIKATEAVPIVRQHLALGRKVVVFHDYKKGGGFNPFNIEVPGKAPADFPPDRLADFEAYKGALTEFRTKFKGLVDAPLGQMASPIDVFSREFPGVLLVNGDEKKSDLLARYKKFQSDDSGPQVMLVQSAKNKGWSGHDATGKHQRVLINLGQPTAPTLAIQQEGRIYRTGQVTDAIQRYLNTGTNWEKWAFATTIAGRASTAENLGMGEQARALKDSFIAAFEESDAYPPGHEGEGKGGKERDKLANAAISAYDRAKTYYWATQKKNSKTKAQEGADYFATPEPVGFKMAEWLGLRGGESSLEPSGGHGAIARWLPEVTNRTVIEPSNVLRARLAMAMDVGKDRIIDGRFEDHAVVNKYDGIAMNPPFGVGGKLAIEHLAKAVTHLRDGGRVVALIPTGPAADKRFEQWMYGTEERDVKPLAQVDYGIGPQDIYRGDTIKSRAAWAPQGVVIRKNAEGGFWVKVDGKAGETLVSARSIISHARTGPRTQTVRPAEGIYTVADIKLPQVTFERAGTAVATRIVVLEKQTDKERFKTSARNIDLSGITDIKELFDRLEDMSMPARSMTELQGAAARTEKADADARAADEAKASKPKSDKPKAANPDAVGTVDRAGAEIVEHVTQKGKTLRGIVRQDLLKEEAQKIDPYTFRKDGGWFIRDVYLKADGDTPMMSRGRPGAMTEAMVRQVADTISARWDQAPTIVVVQNMQDMRVPEAARNEDARQRAAGATGVPRGLYNRGTVYLVADGLKSVTDAAEALFHEALGHYGLRAVFGPELLPILDQIAAARPDLMKPKAAEYGKDLTVLKQRRQVAEEVLAEMAQTKPNLGYVKRAIAAIRTWLRKNVPAFKDLALTDAEIIQNFILPARGWVERGEKAMQPGSKVALSRSPMKSVTANIDRGLSSLAKAVTDKTTVHRAMFRNGLGWVDFVWGDEGRVKPSGKTVGGRGISHIVEARIRKDGLTETQALNVLSEMVRVIASGPETERAEVAGAVSVKIEHDGYRVGLVKQPGANAWVVTAFELSQVRERPDIDARPPTQSKSTLPRDGLGAGPVAPGDTSPSLSRATRGDSTERGGTAGAGSTSIMGEMDGNGNPMFSRSTLGGQQPQQPGPQNAWQKLKAKALQLSSPESITNLIYELQDKHIDLKNLREHIKDLGGTITDLNDAYLGEELYHKRVAKRTQDFLSEELKPLLADLRARGLDLATLERYLHARHAPEANRVLAERNPNAQMIDAGKTKAAADVKALEVQLQRAKAQGTATKAIDQALMLAREELSRWTGVQAFKGTEDERLSLSGMSDAEAASVVANLPAGHAVHLDALAARVDAMNAKTLDTLEKYGLMEKTSLDAWRTTYQHYVPLHRDEAHPDSVGHPVGQGFSTKGDASKRRTGSNEKVTNILAHIAMQREVALTRGEKNRVAKKLYLMAAQNPDPEIWTVDKPPMIKTVDRETGFVRSGVDPMYRNKANVVMMRIGGRDHAIVFNERNPQAVRLAVSLKNQDIGDVGPAITTTHDLTTKIIRSTVDGGKKGTRWLASVNTQYNPVFGIINFARDVQAAVMQLSTTPIAGQERAVAAYVWPALKGIYSEVRSRRAGQGRGTGDWAKLWEDMQDEGGTTGFRELFAQPDERVQALENELKALDRGKTMEAAHAVVDWLSDYNEVMENAVRLAAYKVALDSGMSKERAASVAKNITVNFNRKGRTGGKIGAWYAFFNAAVQGTTRMVETLKGPTGQKIMLGGVMLGAVNTMLAMAVMGAGDDDDNWSKIPGFVKERSVIVPLGGADYIAIPMPLGYHVLPNIGRKLVEMAFGSDPTESTVKQAGEMLRLVLDAFNPLGGSTNMAQMLMPTIADPAIALLQNKDWTNKQIYREDNSNLDPTPGHTRTKDSASFVSKWLSERLGKLSGGTDYQPGAINWTPDQIDYIFGQVTGGVGREALKALTTAQAPFTGDDLPPNKIPLVGRIYGNTRGPTSESEKFYENVTKLNGIEREMKGRARNGEDVDAYAAQEPLSELIGMGNAMQSQISKLRQARKEVIRLGEPGYQDEVKALNKSIGEVMKNLNQEVKRAKMEAVDN